MPDSPYAEAVKGLTDRYDPVAAATPLRFPPAVVDRQHLPAVRPEQLPVVHQPLPLTPPERPYDPWPTRMAFGSVLVLSSGTAVWIACAGLHSAGPYLPWLAGSLAALTAFVAALKARSGGSVRIGNVHMGDHSNFQAGQQR